MSGDYKFLRLAERREEALTDVEAIQAAKAAWQAAKEAQIELSSDQHGLHMLFKPGKVTYIRMRGALHEAREQRERAQRVEAALQAAIDAFHATRIPDADA